MNLEKSMFPIEMIIKKIRYRFSFFYLCLVLLPHSSSCMEASLVNPPLTGNALGTLCFISPSEGWAAGANGIIVHTVDSGFSWEIQPVPVSYPPSLFSIAFIDKDSGYAVGGTYGRPFALKTIDGGKHWIDVSSKFPQGKLQKICITRDRLWVAMGKLPTGNAESNLAMSRDRGETWEYDTVGNGGIITDIEFLDDSSGFICSTDGYTGKTQDAGRNWTEIIDSLSPHSMWKMCFPSSSAGFAIGRVPGGIVQTDAAKDQWVWGFRIRGQLNAIDFLNNDSGIVFGSWNPNMCIKTIDGGRNWSIMETKIMPQVTDYAFCGKNHGIAVCWNGAIHVVYGLADSSVEITKNTGMHLQTIDFCDSLHGLAGSKDDGSLLLTDDGGATWIRKFLPDSEPVSSITGFSNGRVIVNNYLSNDFGLTWDTLNSASRMALVYKLEPYSLEAFGVQGDTVLFSKDAGVSWQSRGTIPFPDTLAPFGLQQLYFLNARTGWAISAHGSVSKTSDSGLTWQTLPSIPADIAANDIFFLDVTHGWVSGDWGSVEKPLVFYTHDGGATWSGPSKVNFSPDLLAQWTELPFQTRMLKIRADNLSALWGLSQNGLLFSSDTGKTWNQVALPQTGYFFYNMFLSRNGKALYVTGDDCEIWKCTDLSAKVVKRHRPVQNNCFRGGYGNVYDISGRKVAVNLLRKSIYTTQGVYLVVDDKNNSSKKIERFVIIK